MPKAPQLDIVGLSDPIISSASALSPTRSPLIDRNGMCSPISEMSTSQHHNNAGLVISEEHITLGEREPLLNGSTGVRQPKKPFYRPRPLWYVPFISFVRRLLWTHLPLRYIIAHFAKSQHIGLKTVSLLQACTFRNYIIAGARNDTSAARRSLHPTGLRHHPLSL